ncbi:endolytic transglycosylase MltG [Jeotgalibaca caeni]|uniref:endolytic transglycosylase MltG n=1 Tax=Jeotgalibaca caeni TaxID=3028623 RepID=UPI00237D50FD|nr:endolytic transglycosylase MltG [Jeotgalibaca caeni]MDE1548405.1 endolytic transglycosylase MltG [Jeotgalibaca caeni]
MVKESTNQPNKEQDIETHPEKNDSYKKRAEERYDMRRRESSLIKKIVFSIIFIGVLLLLVLGVVGYNYVTGALVPLDESSEEIKEVEIPMGTSTKGIAEILEEESIVKDATVFNYYMKIQNAPEFQAGFYQLSASMELDEIIETLEVGGTPTPLSDDYKILVKEGATAEEIAEEFAAKSDYTVEEFLKVMDDEAFVAELMEEFPHLLTDAVKKEGIRHRLEGYLFPATYDYLSHYTPEDMIRTMVQKTDEVLRQYRGMIENSELDLHSLLTIASLVEKEGVTYEDRQMIAGVFYNRLANDMPLQSDISIIYALEEHLEYVTIADTEVDSPYNLYLHRGLGPGPFNNPSEDAIKATLTPAETDYFYFLADLETGEVYFSETFEEHLELQDQYVEDPNEG